MSKPTRPILRYHGGKWLLAEWIIDHFPKHRVYVEPFGGAGSVLLQKDRSQAEVYNDLDGEIVNLFHVMRDNGKELIDLLSLTPFSRHEFELSYESTSDNIEQARRTVLRSFAGFGSAAASGQSTGFRTGNSRDGTQPANDWKNLPGALHAIVSRLQGVLIENIDAVKLIRNQDKPDVLFYIDPPYVLGTRSKARHTKQYRFEMSDEDHSSLCACLLELKGMVVLSCYENKIYRKHLSGWHKVSRRSMADGARERLEVIYINPSCWKALKRERAQLEIEF